MATNIKCDYCPEDLKKNTTVVHTERKPGLWDLHCSMCPDCSLQLKAMLEKVKNQKSWAGWTALEREVDSLLEEKESLKSELKFIRQGGPICHTLEVVKVASKPAAKGAPTMTMMVHRSILISNSTVIKKFLSTPEEVEKQQPIELPYAPRVPAVFEAFIEFLYTAELKPEIIWKHGQELMKAANENAIGLLKRKCEDYYVETMTTDNTIYCLQVAQRYKSTAITAAALKQIQRNPTGFAKREDYLTLLKEHPAPLAEVLHLMLKRVSSENPNEKKPKAKGDSDPDSDTKPQRFLRTCTCSVHPVPHPVAPGCVLCPSCHCHAPHCAHIGPGCRTG